MYNVLFKTINNSIQQKNVYNKRQFKFCLYKKKHLTLYITFKIKAVFSVEFKKKAIEFGFTTRTNHLLILFFNLRT